jgi:hypothetical protein
MLVRPPRTSRRYLEQQQRKEKHNNMSAIFGPPKDKVKERHSISGNLVETTINSFAPEEFPAMPANNQPSMPLEPGFGLALRQALECCSEDPSRYILHGAWLDVTDKKFHYVVGTNGRCLYSANSFCFDLKKSVVIPDSKFLEWPDLMDQEPGALSVEPGEEAQEAKDGKPAKEAKPGWVKLQSGRWTFLTKEIQGTFPNWKQAVSVIRRQQPNGSIKLVLMGVGV